MKNEIQGTGINPDVVEKFMSLIEVHCESSEEALAILSTLCYNLMISCGIHAIDSQMRNGDWISVQLRGIDVTEKTFQNIH